VTGAVKSGAKGREGKTGRRRSSNRKKECSAAVSEKASRPPIAPDPRTNKLPPRLT
jgi:hypothetical protein